MIFKTEKYKAQWDTWLYYHGGIHYLYYLITEYSPGEGIGLAVSRDGVHYEDRGLIIQASSDMVHYMGTGSVWEDPAHEGQFLINYSEWRLDESGKPVQNILFARSCDLIHWTKWGDEKMFRIDKELYEPYGRWDCINTFPREKGGYWGSWTATPKSSENLNGGIGMGYSDDGLNWKALPPPVVEPEGGESGDFVRIGYKWYALFGRGMGMAVYTADNPTGPYREQPKNSLILSPKHSYFARFYRVGDELLVNHHVMNGLVNHDPRQDRSITFAAPLKKAVLDSEGILRLCYWQSNDALKGPAIGIDPRSDGGDRTFACEPADFSCGIFVEGSIDLDDSSKILFQIDGTDFAISASRDGVISFLQGASPGDKEVHRADRQRSFPGTSSFRLLLRKGMAEFYLDGELAECWRLDCPVANQVRPGYIGSGVVIKSISRFDV